MGRIKLSIVILAVLISLGTVSGIYVNGGCRKVSHLAETALEFMAEDETAAVEETVGQLIAQWKSLRKKASFFVRSNMLLEADRICARLEHLTNDGSGEIQAELSELTRILQCMVYNA